MIWFSCKKCQKVHGRPENSIGAMIFCDCGQSLTVPWESTAAEPSSVPVAEAPRAPKLEPIQFDVWRSQAPVAPPAPPPPSYPAPRYEVGLPPTLAPMPSRRGPRPIDPNLCFNHDSSPQRSVCVDCGLHFCADCTCSFEGVNLCGPCKNYRAKVLQLPSRAGASAWWCVLLAMLTAPVVFALFPMSQRWGSNFIVLFALIPQTMALLFGLFVLARPLTRKRALDWTLAISGVTAAAVMTVVCLLLVLQGTKLN